MKVWLYSDRDGFKECEGVIHSNGDLWIRETFTVRSAGDYWLTLEEAVSEMNRREYIKRLARGS